MQTCEVKGNVESAQVVMDSKTSDAHLVEFEGIEKIVELAVLRGFFETNEMLLKTVESELLLVIDVDFERLYIMDGFSL